jgi:hypothetical protein
MCRTATRGLMRRPGFEGRIDALISSYSSPAEKNCARLLKRLRTEKGMLFTFLNYDHSFSSKCHLGVIPRRRTSECRPPTLAQGCVRTDRYPWYVLTPVCAAYEQEFSGPFIP